MNNKLTTTLNVFQKAKKNNQLSMILIVSFSAIICITSLALNYLSKRQLLDQAIVVDSRNGMILDYEVQRREKLLLSSIKGHVTRAITYSNAFNRSTIKTNQKKALFLMDRQDAFTIFGYYKKQKSYDDALQQGHIYQVDNVKITHLDLDNGEPYRLKVQAQLIIKDGARIETWKIDGQGKVTYHEPIYPQNEAGLWLTDYRQKYTKTTAENE